MNAVNLSGELCVRLFCESWKSTNSFSHSLNPQNTKHVEDWPDMLLYCAVFWGNDRCKCRWISRWSKPESVKLVLTMHCLFFLVDGRMSCAGNAMVNQNCKVLPWPIQITYWLLTFLSTRNKRLVPSVPQWSLHIQYSSLLNAERIYDLKPYVLILGFIWSICDIWHITKMLT